MRAAAAIVALAIASAQAQNSNTKYTSELDMTIDPNTVSQTIRATWCQGQTNTCGLLCNANPDKNTCSENDLKWQCTCASNSSMPGIQYYRQTMPTYICQELFDQCIKANVGNQDGQKGCTNNISALCAKIDPPNAAVSDPGSGSSSASSSAGPSATASSPSSAATGNKVSSTSSRALAGPTAAPVGNGALVAAMGLVAYIL